MFRKSIITALTIAMVTTSAFAVTTTTASAKNGRNGAATIGAILGLAAGAAIVAGHRHRKNRRHYDYRPYREVCFDKPIRRWNRYGELIIVGYRTVCR